MSNNVQSWVRYVFWYTVYFLVYSEEV